ncbi:cytochrome c family protein [Parasphingorhabdus sp.]|uniref:c-type cytochrome n=1 Tax=Parasphingorhabdus sp. TaxID=2709688 RepID=UPI00326397B2
MVKIKAMASAVALSALATACSGGGSEPNEPPETSAEPAVETAGETAAEPEETTAEQSPPADGDLSTKDGVAYASLTGSAEAGAKVFAQCRTCHVTDPGVNRIGPSLAGIVGRDAGSIKGFKYSAANASSSVTWTEEQLYQYLEDPQKVVPKTKMIFAGLPDAQKRADLIAYLKDPG